MSRLHLGGQSGAPGGNLDFGRMGDLSGPSRRASHYPAPVGTKPGDRARAAHRAWLANEARRAELNRPSLAEGHGGAGLGPEEAVRALDAEALAVERQGWDDPDAVAARAVSEGPRTEAKEEGQL